MILPGVGPVGLGACSLPRGASTMVTSVVRPVVSTPVPIASKVSPTTQLLIGPTAVGGGAGYSSSPNPMGAGAVSGGLVTNLVVSGAFPTQPAVQLINPAPQSSVTAQNNGPAPLMLQASLAPPGLTQVQQQQASLGSGTPTAGGKAFQQQASLAPPGLTQVQYILPTLPASNPKSPSPQLPAQATSVFTLPSAPPTHGSLANGKQASVSPLAGYASSPAVGVVSPGAGGEAHTHRNTHMHTHILISILIHTYTCTHTSTLSLTPILIHTHSD